MTYHPTVLNISSAFFVVGILVYSLLNWKVLSAGEGWGVVAMFGLLGVACVAGLADLILQALVKNSSWVNGIGLAIVIGLAIAIILG